MSNTTLSTRRPASAVFASTASDNSSSTSYETNRLSMLLLAPRKSPIIDNTVSSPRSVANSALAQSFGSLLESGKGSDLTITCQGETFKVHKAIVCLRSELFTAACWDVSKNPQNTRSHIDLPNHDPSLLRKALRYLYFLNYHYIDSSPIEPENKNLLNRTLPSTPNLQHPPSIQSTHRSHSPSIPITSSPDPSSSLALHATNHLIGLTYGIPELTLLAHSRFTLVLHNMMTHGTAASRMSDLCAAIEIIFQSPPKKDKNGRRRGEQQMMMSMMNKTGVGSYDDNDDDDEIEGEEIEIEEEVLEMREQILEYVKLDLLFLLRVREFKGVLGRCPEFAFELLVREVEDREGG